MITIKIKNILNPALISVSLFMLSCSTAPQPEQKQPLPEAGNTLTLTGEQLRNAGIRTGKPEMRRISSLLKLNGKIDVPPQGMVSISVPLGGYLKSTELLPGMHVSKGQVLAVMEDPQYIQLQQEYLTAKAQFTFLENEYNRQKDLNADKATSDKVFEQVRSTFQAQQILVRSLEQKLKLIGLDPARINASNISKSINVYSPVTGFVSAVRVNIGRYVNPSDVLFDLVDPDDIHLVLTVFEKDVNKLAIGQKLYAYTNSNPGKKYLCEIILISRSISSDHATQVHCHFGQYDKTLLPGMFMNADIELSGSYSNALPDEAIVHFENKNYVFIARGNNRFDMQEVQTGSAENGFTEVFLPDTAIRQTFVIKGAYTLLMALKNVSEE